MPTRKTKAMQIEEGRAALEMQFEGMGQREIAKVLGMDQATVSRRIQLALDSVIKPDVERMRRKELYRLEKYERDLAPLIADGGANAIKAVATALGVLDRKAKMLGLNAPVVTKVEKEESAPLPDAVAELIARAQASSGEALRLVRDTGTA